MNPPNVTLIILAALLLVVCSLGGHAQTRWPGEDVLGYGYDVWGYYASQVSLKDYCLFDYPVPSRTDTEPDSYLQLAPEIVNLSHIGRNEARTVEGSSRREYAENLAIKTGLSGGSFFFGGSVEGYFGKTSSNTTQNFYFTYMDVIKKWRVTLDTRDLGMLRDILEPQFGIDLEKMDPAQLFSTYGTHYVARAYLGGRADYTSASTITEKTEAREVAAAVTLKYRGVKGEAEFGRKQQEKLTEAHTTASLVVTGGNAEYANDIANNDQYNLWASGIAEMPVLANFAGEGSLRPIWELTADEPRRDELSAEFERMKQAHPLPEETVLIEPTEPEVAQLSGTNTIQQMLTNRYVDAHGSKQYDYGLVTRYAQNDDSQRWIFQPLGEDVYTIQQVINNRYVDAHGSDEYDYHLVTRTAQNDDSQKWIVKPLGGDIYTIQQVVNNRYVDAHDTQKYDYRLVTRTAQNDDSQRWKIKQVE